MDIEYIKEVTREQVRLNVELCEARYALREEHAARAIQEREAEVERLRGELASALAALERKGVEVEELQREKDELQREKDELAGRLVEERGQPIQQQPLKKVKARVKRMGAIPHARLLGDGDEKEPIEQNDAEEMDEAVNMKKAKRKEYMRNYMRKNRDMKAAKKLKEQEDPDE